MEFQTIIVGILSALLVVIIFRIRTLWRIATSRRQGSGGEDVAIILLKKMGCKILDSQLSRNGYWSVGNQEIEFLVRADFLVEYKGEHWVVEVKTGEAASLKNRITRRQLREYYEVYPEYKLALLDVTRGLWLPVAFPEEA